MALARPPLDVRLQIVKQESVTQDVSFVNGQTKVVHSCIKGSPFKLELALVGNFERSVINFNRFVITAVLLYDYAEGNRGLEERQVSFVKTRPLEVLEYSVNDAGDRLTLIVVLHVLSSQHEHSLFLIKIANADLGLVAISQPIRVVSKELQLKGKAKPRQATAAATAAASRRPLTEEVVQYLQRIESQSQTHHQLLLSILEHLAGNEAAATVGERQQPSQRSSFEGVPGEPAAKRQKTDDHKTDTQTSTKNHNNSGSNASDTASSTSGSDVISPSFEESFATLVRAFGCLPRDQRTETVRRTVRSCPDRETMSDMLGHLAAAGMLGSFGLANLNGSAGAPTALPSYDTAPMSLPSNMTMMMRNVKPEPTSDLADQVIGDMSGMPTSTTGSFASTPRAPSLSQLPYLPPATYEPNNGVPPHLLQPQQGPDDSERKQQMYAQQDLDTSRLYNELFASWPYENLNNSLSQSQQL